MERNINFNVNLTMSLEDIKLLVTLEKYNYRGFTGADINDETRPILHGFIAKGIVFNSQNDAGDVALFLTPLGEQILDKYLTSIKILHHRKEILDEISEDIAKLKNEKTIDELMIHDYYKINQKMYQLTSDNERLSNSSLIQILNPNPIEFESDGEMEECVMVGCNDGVLITGRQGYGGPDKYTVHNPLAYEPTSKLNINIDGTVGLGDTTPNALLQVKRSSLD
jgi:hypothetical protein